MARIALIVGSVRENRQGIKVARWMEEKLKSCDHTVYFIDPLELNLPLLNKMYKEMTNPTSQLVDLRNKINDAEGYMPVTPEYNHNTSAAMKNTLDYFLEGTISNRLQLYPTRQVLSEALMQHNS